MIEDLRRRAISSVFGMQTFQTCWPIWHNAIQDLTDNFRDPARVYDLGSRLSEVFKLTGEGGRDQSNLSGGGAAWEGLICWYLNVVLTDTRAVVIKQSKSLLPEPLSDAMSVVYKNTKTNSESDLSGIIFPNDELLLSGVYNHDDLNKYVANNISNISLHNIQCKTNWNDNAQIPMLWDMVYTFRGVKHHKVRIGSNGYDLNDLKEFSYSFVTVPTQKKDILPNSMAVRRVESLSGGNFWGRKTKAGVAESLSEIFKRVFGPAFDQDVRGHIAKLVDNGRISLPNA